MVLPSLSGPAIHGESSPDRSAGALQRQLPPRTAAREKTRVRLVRSGFRVFAKHGYGHTTVKMVCDDAGFTRGAFYSNYVSLQELFIDVWKYHVELIMEQLAAQVERLQDRGVGETELIEGSVASIPIDARWFRVNADFISASANNAEMRKVAVLGHQMLVANVMPIMMFALEGMGRKVTQPEALAYAVIAVHEGTAAMVVLNPDSEMLRRNRVRLLTETIYMYSEEI